MSPAAPSKLQRWIDLLCALLARQTPVTLAELVREVPGYEPDKGESLRRMFERDKKELRELGIPIETVALDDSEQAYRLDRNGFYLPYLHLVGDGSGSPARIDKYGYRSLTRLAFQPDELAAVVAAAERVRQLGVPLLTAHAAGAVRKLALDLPLDAGAGDAARMHAGRVDGALFDQLAEAVRRRKRVTCTYFTMGSGETRERILEPLGLMFLGHHWYLAARDPGGDAIKNFRLSRLRGVAVNTSAPETPDFVRPPGFRLQAHAQSRHAWELGDQDAITVTVRFDLATGAVRAAADLGDAVEGDATRRRFRVRRLDSFLRWLLALVPSAAPLDPPEVVAAWDDLVARTLAHHREVSA